MGFINLDDLVNRLGSDENVLSVPTVDEFNEKKENDFVDDLVNGVVFNRGESNAVRGMGRGRRVNDVNIPPIFREVIGVQANISGETGKEIADAYGISANRVALFKDGTVTHGKDTDSNRQLSAALENSLGKVRNKALDRMSKALSCMKDESLEDRTAKELSMIAANLARVVASTMPKDKDQSTVNNYQTIFMKPEVKPVEQYKIIEA